MKSNSKLIFTYWRILLVLLSASIIGLAVFLNHRAVYRHKGTPESDQIYQSNTARKDSAGGALNATEDIDRSLRHLRKVEDEFEDVVYYWDKKSPVYIDVNALTMYLSRSGNIIYPRIRIQYAGPDWLFISKYQFVVDGQRFFIAPGEKIIRDHDGGDVWEYLDQVASEQELLLLRRISKSKSARIRYAGNEDVLDRTITRSEKLALARILAVFDILSIK